MRMILIAVALLFSSMAGAACPVGKNEGDTWCKKGMQWKCERCGSEYCEIITGKKCVKDDDGAEAAETPFGRFLASYDQAIPMPTPRGGSARR